jgi:hypothetical protein
MARHLVAIVAALSQSAGAVPTADKPNCLLVFSDDHAYEAISARYRTGAKKADLLMTHHKASHREWAPAFHHLGHDRNRKYPEPSTLFDNYFN